MTTSTTARRSSRSIVRAARWLRPALGPLVIAAVAACSSTKSSTPTDIGASAMTRWLEPSPALARDINIKALEVSMITDADEFIRLSDWFQTVGEPAYPKLLEMVSSPDNNQTAFALSVIAAQRDVRMLKPLMEHAPLESVVNPSHRAEMARALLMLGNTSGVPILIDGLESPNIFARRKCLAALRRGTNVDIPYKPDSSEEERAEGVRLWRQWWSDMRQDVLLDR